MRIRKFQPAVVSNLFGLSPQVSATPKYTVNVPSAFIFVFEALRMLLTLFM
jgi:hypothetical protein